MARARVSPFLMRCIPAVVAEPRWCGGLSRTELASVLHVREFDRVFELSLIVCYRRGQIDFCGREYVAVPSGKSEGGNP